MAGALATLWTPAAGKRLRLLGWSLGVIVAAAAINFNEGPGNTLIGRPTPVLAVNGTDTQPWLGNGGAGSAADVR